MDTDSSASEGAKELIAQRIRQLLPEIGRTMIGRYQTEIVDYATLNQQDLTGDVLQVSLDNLESLLDRVQGEGPRDEAADESFRLAAARRVHQGVSLESLLHAYRLWGQTVWESILEAVSADRPEEKEAALALAGLVIDHLNVVSTASTRAYLDELKGLWSDREVLLRDLFEEMLAGRGGAPLATNTAQALGVDLWDDYQVVVARRPALAGESGDHPLLAARRTYRRVLDAARAHLRPPRGTLLTGTRQEDVVALYPLFDGHASEAAHSQLVRLAQAVARDGFSVGVGGPHRGRQEVSQSYQEAREAATIASESGTLRKPVMFDDVLIDYVLRSNPLSERLAQSTLGRLLGYDHDHHSDLMDTARAFLDCGFNLTKTARKLSVHPNTVVYRLRRIREISGRDLQNPDDMLAFTVAMRVVGPEQRARGEM